MSHHPTQDYVEVGEETEATATAVVHEVSDGHIMVVSVLLGVLSFNIISSVSFDAKFLEGVTMILGTLVLTANLYSLVQHALRAYYPRGVTRTTSGVEQLQLSPRVGTKVVIGSVPILLITVGFFLLARDQNAVW
eukprot:CAMPEP_0182916704 /NCGR_PEP_ID=MMETSP0105_2-20130417/1104_1 /TAXON_ID=81532 ORGANISM="Acanthoeca-like sp., Strain 10tr" /NCGR_SAMPLE_ID=MMETSP0105_2 /ASSEMBLY_ACC=CAM_ASM_000205 /LENGTH=134 /DNA_ID=CAMNT_0025053669 /DNA_START=49 /DNA_END=450 /DNA_ORIENTATION=-